MASAAMRLGSLWPGNPSKWLVVLSVYVMAGLSSRKNAGLVGRTIGQGGEQAVVHAERPGNCFAAIQDSGPTSGERAQARASHSHPGVEGPLSTLSIWVDGGIRQGMCPPTLDERPAMLFYLPIA